MCRWYLLVNNNEAYFRQILPSRWLLFRSSCNALFSVSRLEINNTEHRLSQLASLGDDSELNILSLK
jgi:hypothetical protein